MTLRAEDRDPSIDPGVDFYRHANGGWLDTHPIPPGFGAWGAIEEVHTRNEDVVHDLLVRAAASPVDDLDAMLGDYFAAGMDTAAIEAAGLDPIRALLDAVATVGSADDVVALLPTLHGAGVSPLFDWTVTVDHDDSTRNLFWMAQGGLGLPERDAYLNDGEAAVALRAAYVDHVAAQLTNAATPGDARALAEGVLAFETALAGTHLRAEERRDLSRTLNRYDLDALRALAPALDLPAYLVALGAGAARTTNVEHPATLAALPDLLAATDPEVLRAYLAFHVVRATASALPARIEDEAFDFYGRRIQGKQQQREREKRVIAALTADVGEALGRRYVESTFPPSAKARALHMVDAIVEQMRRSLETRTWMSEQTRTRGLAKLAALRVKIGYPDRWRDWSGLRLDRSSFAANRLAAARFEVARLLRQLEEPVDPDEWEMPPHVVNAYYHPTRNEIVFPAGILQPPMFDADADDAVNFGGIGTVIAHEITHGFDDQGRQFDADGTFREWWTDADREHFTALADRLVAQYEGYESIPGVPVNGRLTLGENIADLGGLALAERAHAHVSAGAPDVDGLTPAQRFFLANATLWRANTSDELARTLAQIDPHSPRRLRVLGPLANLGTFQEAFALPDDAPMMRPCEERIEIW